ncbi:AraC family transcriptional regulator [Parabacteroides merdae]|uniref:AraC family transcriptional regulator n=1 Tax=Parabacteroides merdae TaxID=46503 RepID=UPI0032193359
MAIGLLVSLTTRKWQPVGWDIASFPVTLIASSQTLLFTFSLILLFNEQYATRQRILLHATPSLLFTLAYAGACLIWKDHPVYAYSEWKSLVTNPPSLIRTLYLLAYIIQSGIYAKLFLHERHTDLSLLGGVKTEDRWLKLGQVTSAFFLASGIGLCTLSLALNPYLPHEITVTFLFTVFYFAFGIFYANFSSTYRDVRTRIREQNSAFSPPAGADMEELICYLQPDDDNNRLFKDIEAYFQKEQPYLDPDFRISDLPRTIGANPHKLSTAVGRATGLTVQDYVLRLRIGHSADLLLLPENAERTIEDIAFSSGFQSTSTYNRNFLKLMKTTPSRFRSRT